MNYKLLFPTYRNRYLFIRHSLEKWGRDGKFEHALNLGTGEGDYDRMIASFCNRLTAVDINEQDIAYARRLNADVPNIEYGVENALKLSFADNSFDLIISVDVIEHVGEPEIMLREIQRVLKPGGLLFITFPQLDFPFTYDPINRILSWFSEKKIPQGAYAFGHEYLISQTDFRQWSAQNHLNVQEDRNLSGYFVALLEMYWTGIVQSLFKANATNQPLVENRKMTLRPSAREPFLTRLTDGIIRLDDLLFQKASHAVGKGFILQKNSHERKVWRTPA